MVFRWFLCFVFFVLGVCLFFDLSYLANGIRCTYLRGETSAQVDDFRFFHTRSVVSETPVEIPNSNNYLDTIKNTSLRFALEKSKSTAFLVVQNDSVVLESYWRGGGPDVLSNSFSMAKSLMSLLVGAAIDDGFISSVDQSVIDFVPEIKNLNDQKPVKIKHLLSMSSGLEWLENYKRPISVTAKAYYGNNIKNLMFERNFVSNPGEFFKYQSGDTQLLGVLLERAVGESVSSYAGRKVWSKIGATKNALWSLDAKEGMEKTFCCFNSTARDFAKIGLVMLGGGEINDSVVISPEYFNWLFETPVLKMGNKRSRHFDKLINHYSNSWYIAKIMGKDVFYARGFLGQYIVVVPSLNLVFVRLGQKENPSSSENNDYLLTDNLKFFIEQVILDFNN
jgi:CubicO group peptidase (beta-lactamase class C family)